MAKLSQFSVLPKTFHIDLPTELSTELQRCTTDQQAKQLGIEWGIAQCRELIQHGVPSLHFYPMGAVDSIRQIAQQVY